MAARVNFMRANTRLNLHENIRYDDVDDVDDEEMEKKEQEYEIYERRNRLDENDSDDSGGLGRTLSNEDIQFVAEYEGHKHKVMYMKEWTLKGSHLITCLILFFILETIIWIYIFVMQHYERDNFQDLMNERMLIEQEMATNLFKNHGVTQEEFQKIKGTILNNLQRPNPWADLHVIYGYTFTVITTIGYGTIIPITENGRLNTVFFGCVSTVLTAGIYLQLFQIERTLFKYIVRSLDRQGYFVGETYLSVFHFCLITIEIYICCLILWIADDTHHKEHWSQTSTLYAYYQVLSTIGFGDFVVFSNPLKNNRKYVSYLLYPPLIFLVIGLFPIWLVEVVSLIEKMLSCGTGFILKNSSGISMSRREIYGEQFFQKAQTIRKNSIRERNSLHSEDAVKEQLRDLTTIIDEFDDDGIGGAESPLKNLIEYMNVDASRKISHPENELSDTLHIPF